MLLEVSLRGRPARDFRHRAHSLLLRSAIRAVLAVLFDVPVTQRIIPAQSIREIRPKHATRSIRSATPALPTPGRTLVRGPEAARVRGRFA